MSNFTFAQFKTVAKNSVPTTKKSFLKNLSAIPKIGMLLLFLAVVPFSAVGQGDPCPDVGCTAQDIQDVS